MTEPSRRATALLLGLIVLVGGGLRVTGLDWDRGAHLHPDERFLAFVNEDIGGPDGIGGWFDTAGSPLNPANADREVVYGTAPLFAVKGLSAWLHDGAATGAQPARAATVGLDAIGVPLLDDDGEPTFDSGYESVLVGRFASALLDVVTILLVFELGRALRGRGVGLASAAAYATCVIAIQHAHFFVVEPMLTTATAAALVAASHVAKGRGRVVLALGGVAAGLAGASKVSGLAIGLVLIAAAGLARWPAARRSWDEAPPEGRDRLVGRVARAVGPFAVDGLVLLWSAFLTFRVLQPYAFSGWLSLDPRWTEPLRRLSEVQAGQDVPPNVQWADRTFVVEPLWGFARFALGLPLTALAVAGLVVALRRRATWRAEPMLVVLAGWVALVGALFLPRFVPAWRYLLPAIPALCAFAGVGLVALLRRRGAWRVGGIVLALGALVWGVAFANGVYGRTNTRLAAAQWVVDEVPPGSVLSFQEWDDSLPFAQVDPGADLPSEKLSPFALTTPDDARALVASLDRVDYVVETSDRVTGSVSRVPARYGTLLRYYDALEDGRLGFEHVASFRSGPSLLGVDVDDSGSEEAFRVYDHAPVDIWRKTDDFSVQRALAIIQPDRAVADESVPLTAAGANGLLQRGDLDDPATGPTFDEAFGDRLSFPALWWWLWWSVLAWAALPWTTRLLRALPDRGWGLTKVLGPMAVLVPLWFAVAVGLVRFSAWSIGLATLVGIGVGLTSAWRHRGDPDRDLRPFARERWRSLLCLEVVVLGAYLAVLAVRAANPDLWFHPLGGEKPMAAAYVTAIGRTSTFPPPDPWFSGGTMNYYYGTWYAVAAPARLLGISPDVALNLAVATAASLLAASTWSVGAALARLGRAVARPRAALVGLLAVVLVLVVGNLATARQQLDRLADALAGRDLAPFDWWGISRLSPGRLDINEFPGWSVLFADPHPHLLWAPILVTGVGLLVAYVATRAAADRRAAWALAGVVGALLAWARMSHTWDLPTLGLLAVGAVLAGTLLDPGDPGDAPGWRSPRWRRSAGHLLVIGATFLVVGQPYAARNQVFDSGFTASPAHTPFGSFLLQHGTVLALVAGAAVVRLLRLRRDGEVPRLLASRAGVAGVAVMVVGGGLLAALAGGPVLVLCAAVVAVALPFAVHELRTDRLGPGLAWALVAAGAGLAAVPELVVVINDLSRMNTVFKFGVTAWLLLALGTAGVVASAVAGSRHPRSLAVASAVLLLPGLLFWPSATGPRIDARFDAASTGATLDGRGWLADGPIEVEANEVPLMDVTADEPMIDWLRANAPGGTTIVEAAGPSYSWVGRVSVATGLPTVIGWKFHQTQQRRGYGVEVDERFAAVERLYADPDQEQAMRTLAAYRPDLVIVGSVERAMGTPEAIDGLAELPGLTVAWSEGDAVIYEVDRATIDRELAELDAARMAAAATAGEASVEPADG